MPLYRLGHRRGPAADARAISDGLVEAQPASEAITTQTALRVRRAQRLALPGPLACLFGTLALAAQRVGLAVLPPPLPPMLGPLFGGLRDDLPTKVHCASSFVGAVAAAPPAEPRRRLPMSRPG